MIYGYQVTDRIPERYRHRLQVNSADLHDAAGDFVDSFVAAVEIFFQSTREGAPIPVVIGVPPYNLSLGSGTLMFAQAPGVLGCAIDRLVFLDVGAIAQYPKPIQIACVLEEFVHAGMGVADENLTKKIVTALYGGVRFKGGKFLVAPQVRSTRP